MRIGIVPVGAIKNEGLIFKPSHYLGVPAAQERIELLERRFLMAKSRLVNEKERQDEETLRLKRLGIVDLT